MELPVQRQTDVTADIVVADETATEESIREVDSIKYLGSREKIKLETGADHYLFDLPHFY